MRKFCFAAAALLFFVLAGILIPFDSYRSPSSTEVATRAGRPIIVSSRRISAPEDLAGVAIALENFRRAKPRRFVDYLHKWRIDFVSSRWEENGPLREEMSLAFSHDAFHGRFPESPSLIFHGPYGWQVRLRDDAQKSQETESHTDQLLATCSEAGVPLGQAIFTEDGAASVNELLQSSRKNFVADQEFVWSLIAYCGYLPHQPQWQNRFGEWHSYADLARRLLSNDKNSGACAGAHKHYALSYMLRIDEEQPILNRGLRRDIRKYLQSSADELTRSQLQDGSWDHNWANDSGSTQRIDQLVNAPDGRLLVTGHHLEWLGIMPPDIEFDRSRFQAAVEFVLRSLQRSSPESILENYCPHAHAARVLSLIEEASESHQILERET